MNNKQSIQQLTYNKTVNNVKYYYRDEDAPQQIVDSTAEMPADWLEDEPQTIDDPGMNIR